MRQNQMITLEKDDALKQSKQASLAGKTATLQWPPWLKIPDAVRYSTLSRTRIYNLLNEGSITSRLIGTHRVIERDSLDAFLNAQPSTSPKEQSGAEKAGAASAA